MPLGHVIRHGTDRNQIRVTPIMTLPVPTAPGQVPKRCPTCHVHHPVKSLHIWLGPSGEAIVSQGVLDLLQGRAEGLDGYTIVGHTNRPPALRVGKDADRAQIDNQNRSIIIYNDPTKETEA